MPSGEESGEYRRVSDTITRVKSRYGLGGQPHSPLLCNERATKRKVKVPRPEGVAALWRCNAALPYFEAPPPIPSKNFLLRFSIATRTVTLHLPFMNRISRSPPRSTTGFRPRISQLQKTFYPPPPTGFWRPKPNRYHDCTKTILVKIASFDFSSFPPNPWKKKRGAPPGYKR